MSETPWWGSREALSPRFLLEVQAMRGQFGTSWKLVLPTPNSTNPMYWKGQVVVNMAEIEPEKRTHTLHVVYPRNYPNAAAECYCVNPVIAHGGHTYGASYTEINKGAGKMCLFNPSEGQNYGWNPSRSTALTIALWGIQWLYGYYCWTYNGKWPGDEHITRNRGREPLDPNNARDLVSPGRRLSPEERLAMLEQRLDNWHDPNLDDDF